MRTIMRVVIGLVGLFNFAIGVGFLAMPEKLAAAFFLTPVGSQGLATLRADFPGFFIGGAIFALLGAWRADPRPLLVPVVTLALALTGRFVSLAADGMGPAAITPMVAEFAMIFVLMLAIRTFAAPLQPKARA